MAAISIWPIRCSPPTTSTTAGLSRIWSAVRRRSRSAWRCTAWPSPQFRVAVVDLLAQGQTVALRWAAHRTPRRAGVRDAPDRDPDTLLGMTFGRMIGGQIEESWTCWETERGEEPGAVRDIRTFARCAS